MKQTAVEWLISKQKHNKFFDDEIIEQAKQIELAQRIDDYNNGHIDREKNIFKLPK